MNHEDIKQVLKWEDKCEKEKEAFQKGVAYGYRMALQDLGIIKKEGETDVN